MPKDPSIKKVLVIGSGPIIIGSTYTRSAMSGSVIMVAGLELTSTTSMPSLFSARHACVPE